MSFICKSCGATRNRERCNIFVSKIREVVYNLQIKTIFADKEVIKTIKQVNGTEIVKTEKYCSTCLPKEIKPEISEKISRNQLIKTIFRLRLKAKDEEK